MDRRRGSRLADARVTLLGFGGVGRAIAARLKPFEVELRAVASHGRLQDEVEVFPLGKLYEVLAETDIVIASLPGGDATRHVIDDRALSALPDGALVVNVGRGRSSTPMPSSITSAAAGSAPPSTSPTPNLSPRATRCGASTACSSRRTSEGRRMPCAPASHAWCVSRSNACSGEEPLNVVIGG